MWRNFNTCRFCYLWETMSSGILMSIRLPLKVPTSPTRVKFSSPFQKDIPRAGFYPTDRNSELDPDNTTLLWNGIKVKEKKKVIFYFDKFFLEFVWLITWYIPIILKGLFSYKGSELAYQQILWLIVKENHTHFYMYLILLLCMSFFRLVFNKKKKTKRKDKFSFLKLPNKNLYFPYIDIARPVVLFLVLETLVYGKQKFLFDNFWKN